MCIRDRLRQELEVEKATQCVKYIIKQAEKVGCNVVKMLEQEANTPKLRKIAIKKTNIEEVKNEITELEKLLQTESTQEVVEVLVENYQRIIEYYSAMGDGQFNIYLKKMKQLLKKEDILRADK
eukprot:TRINITY_DN8507_c0_g2_i1.p1 TRINITY_DN8507_c0_g2~~TRINITY_DN8507_c0_g2_i1.p1  ORF type:complete len:124 (+),score=41.65 TRINITY_DN8507_c0_g2_i1:68-439(+)